MKDYSWAYSISQCYSDYLDEFGVLLSRIVVKVVEHFSRGQKEKSSCHTIFRIQRRRRKGNVSDGGIESSDDVRGAVGSFV